MAIGLFIEPGVKKWWLKPIVAIATSNQKQKVKYIYV